MTTTEPTDLVPTPDTAIMPTTGHAASLMSFGDVERLAGYIVRSRMFGVQNIEQAIALMMLCQADGLHPMQAVRRYHMINGKPSMRADAMLAEFQNRGGRVEWHQRTNEEVSATFSHPSGGDTRVTWTLEDARRAQLLRNGTWSQYPRQMLTARVISEGVRTVLPAVVAGIYTEEEVRDMQLPPAPVRVEAPARNQTAIAPNRAPQQIQQTQNQSRGDDFDMPAETEWDRRRREGPFNNQGLPPTNDQERASRDFGREADRLGLNVRNEDGAPSAQKMCQLGWLVMGGEECENNPFGGCKKIPEVDSAAWVAVTDLLPAFAERWHAAQAEAKVFDEEGDEHEATPYNAAEAAADDPDTALVGEAS